jgi:hypothetical protein
VVVVAVQHIMVQRELVVQVEEELVESNLL